ncbi:MAG: cobaltochelatase CobT-related protein, partial [Acidimicrobiales bacterium]
DTLTEELAIASGAREPTAPANDYRIYTTANDVECRGEDLYRPFVLPRLRRDIDRACSQQAVSPARIAQRLGPLFLCPVDGGLFGGQDHGTIDRARLAQVVANPLNPYVHALPVPQRSTDAAVTFLVDTTGSMKAQRHESVAVLCDTFVRSLEMLEVPTEVLGFSTASWAGGESARQWVADGSPANPGRVADIMHIVYKSFDQTWRQSRLGIAAMLRVDHYREGVDGEALEWAARRLEQAVASHKYLVIISDGFPMEATTASHNGDDYLFGHLRHVVDRLTSHPNMRVGAVTVDHALDEFMVNSTACDLSGTLTLSSYQVLHRLFA